MDQVRKCLHSAWGTEALLLMSGTVFREEEAIQLSNNWSAIQVYYVIYHSTQALHVAQGHPRPDSHPKTQNTFHNQWVSRPGFLHPWTFGYGSIGTVNCPANLNINVDIHPWSACEGENILSLYAKAIKTTRRDDLLEKNRIARERKKQALRRSWDEEENARIIQDRKPRKRPAFRLPQLTPGEKQRIDESTRAFTLIDYVYRLRVKTNYAGLEHVYRWPRRSISIGGSEGCIH